MGRPKANSIHANGLTDRQEMILEFIRSYISENNYPPSVREIGKGVGLASSASVHNNMKKLASLGFLNWDTDKPRTYGLVSDEAWRKRKCWRASCWGCSRRRSHSC